jgi:hypothetical protein
VLAGRHAVRFAFPLAVRAAQIFTRFCVACWLAKVRARCTEGCVGMCGVDVFVDLFLNPLPVRTYISLSRSGFGQNSRSQSLADHRSGALSAALVFVRSASPRSDRSSRCWCAVLVTMPTEAATSDVRAAAVLLTRLLMSLLRMAAKQSRATLATTAQRVGSSAPMACSQPYR